jgi:hypothetical protein
MKRTLTLVLSLIAASTVWLSCASPRANRISEHATLFAALPRGEQAKIEQGLIDVGFRHELVYMAIGKPSKVLKSREPGSDGETWQYHNFVFAPTSASTVAATQTGARYEGRQVTGSSARGGLTSTPRGSATGTLNDSGADTGTLLVDLVDGRVVRIRLEP